MLKCLLTIDVKYYSELRININDNPCQILHLYVAHFLTFTIYESNHVFIHANVLIGSTCSEHGVLMRYVGHIMETDCKIQPLDALAGVKHLKGSVLIK